MADGEELADYLEKIVVALNRAKENLRDHFYHPFSVHEFKARLRRFECTLRFCSRPRADKVASL